MAETDKGIANSREVRMGIGGLSSQVASGHDSMTRVPVEDRASMLARQGDAMQRLVDRIALNPGSERVLYQLQDVQPKSSAAREAQPSNQA